MNMKKKVIYVVTTIVVVVAVAFNVKKVLESNHDYDLTMASIDALSESGGQESNNEGSGIFFYQKLTGDPDFCTLFRYKHLNGEIINSETVLSLDAEWTFSQVEGVKEKCPKKGDGCTVYSCQTTN